MTRIKILSAIAVLSSVIATPVFAQSPDMRGPGSRMEPHRFYRSYDRWNGFYAPPLTKDEYWNLENFGMTGRDPSRIGGKSPWLNPPS
jgi:hypothetical protein